MSAFIVDPSSEGINRRKVPTADSRNYANISFEGVIVSAERILGEVNGASDQIHKVLDFGRIAMSAEMLGNTEEAFAITLNYLKERKQFGVLIGSFQALQHRAAKMFC